MPEDTIAKLKQAARNQVRASVATAIGASVALVVSLIALAIVLSLRGPIDDIRDGTTPSSIAARQGRARLLFDVCAKGASSIDPKKVRDFEISCAGYGTLAQAYKTEGVKPPEREKR